MHWADLCDDGFVLSNIVIDHGSDMTTAVVTSLPAVLTATPGLCGACPGCKDYAL